MVRTWASLTPGAPAVGPRDAVVYTALVQLPGVEAEAGLTGPPQCRLRARGWWASLLLLVAALLAGAAAAAAVVAGQPAPALAAWSGQRWQAAPAGAALLGREEALLLRPADAGEAANESLPVETSSTATTTVAAPSTAAVTSTSRPATTTLTARSASSTADASANATGTTTVPYRAAPAQNAAGGSAAPLATPQPAPTAYATAGAGTGTTTAEPTTTTATVLAATTTTTTTAMTTTSSSSVTAATTSTSSATSTRTSTSSATTTNTVTTLSTATTTAVRMVNPFTNMHHGGAEMTWIGCYEHGSGHDSMAYLALSTKECAKGCPGFAYIALHSEGWCTCENHYPTLPRFSRQVPDHRCGALCGNESSLAPKRYCGSFHTSAAYWVNASGAAGHIAAGDDGAHGSAAPSAGAAQPGHDASAAEAPNNRTGAGISGAGAAAPSTAAKATSAREGAAKAPARSADAKAAADLEGDARNATRRQTKHVLKGIGYAPMPLQESPDRLPRHDFASENTATMWGHQGRGDLGVIRSLGANAVRLYGNDLDGDHGAFLDEAQAQGLQVIGGISDLPYLHMNGSCVETNFNCYRQIRDKYLDILKSGFLMANKSYHSAVRTVVLMNEPDLKFTPITKHRQWCKAMVSAVDGLVDAEHLAGVTGPRPNLTATVSFSLCGRTCSGFAQRPALGQMEELRRAFKAPGLVGYHPQNDLWNVYLTRFENSVNTQNPASGDDGVRHLFLEKYDQAFAGTPVFIGKYHTLEVSGAPWARKVDLSRDLSTILEAAAEPSTMLAGIVFHEFQVRYDKGGQQLAFGLFGLGDRADATFSVAGSRFTARCLVPMGVPREVQACGHVEGGMSYEVESDWLFRVEDVPTPAFCCAKCSELPQCHAWTWVEDAGLDGCGGGTVAPQREARGDRSGRGGGHGASEEHRRLGGPSFQRAPCCDVLEADAGGQTCGKRITNLVNSTGVSFSVARTKVAAAHPEACGECGVQAGSRCWLKGAGPRRRVLAEGTVSGLPVPEPKPSELGLLMPTVVSEAFGGRGLASDDPRFCPASRVQFLVPKKFY